MYAAETATGAFLESLAWAKKRGDLDPPLDEVFSEYEGSVPYDDDQPTLMAQIDHEWTTNGKMSWGQIPASWRTGRELYTLKLPQDGWFIDVGHSETISTVGRQIHKRLESLGIERLTLEHLFSAARAVTTTIARWLRGQNLFDGTRPHGIRYRSKLGDEQFCYAIWLRAVDDGKPIESEPTKRVGQLEILANNPDLQRAARLLDLHVH